MARSSVQSTADDSLSSGEIRPGGRVELQSLMRIRGLEMRAKVVVEGFWTGLHRSPYHGFSVEFTEYRQYSTGDDLRYLDWRLYARSDRYYVKRFEDETNLRCHFLVDASRSMGFGTTGYTKSDYAATLAATMAYFLSQQRDAVGLVTFDRDIVDYIPARYRPRHSHRLMVALEKTPAGEGTDLTVPLARVAELMNKRGLLVLISDMFAPIGSLEYDLSLFRSRGHDVIVFQVLDPSELEFSFSAATQFHDVETGKQMYVDPAAVRNSYRERLEKHNAAIERSCRQLGIDFRRMATDSHLEPALAELMRIRRREGQTRKRFSRQAGRSRG